MQESRLFKIIYYLLNKGSECLKQRRHSGLCGSWRNGGTARCFNSSLRMAPASNKLGYIKFGGRSQTSPTTAL